MANSERSRGAPGAHAFDAATWLSQFAAVGGWWLVGADERISLGWMIEGYSIAENAAAAALWSEAKADPDKVTAIRDHLRSRGPVRPSGDQARAFCIADNLDPPSGHRLTTFVKLADPAPPAQPLAQAQQMWRAAFDAFTAADEAEEEFRRTIYQPADAAAAASGGTVESGVELPMVLLSDNPDRALIALFATPAPDRAAALWKLDWVAENPDRMDLVIWECIRDDVARFLGELT